MLKIYSFLFYMLTEFQPYYNFFSLFYIHQFPMTSWPMWGHQTQYQSQLNKSETPIYLTAQNFGSKPHKHEENILLNQSLAGWERNPHPDGVTTQCQPPLYCPPPLQGTVSFMVYLYIAAMTPGRTHEREGKHSTRLIVIIIFNITTAMISLLLF